MSFNTLLLEDAGIQLIDGDRGRNYPSQSHFLDNGFCLFLSAKNVTNNGFEFLDLTFIDKNRDALLRAGKLQRGDIVLTTRGTIGNIALYNDEVPFEHVRINSGMIILRADENVWNRRFLYFLLGSDYIKRQIEALTSGSAVPQLPARDLKKFELPNIPKALQDKIDKIIGDLYCNIQLNTKMNHTLESIAQAIFKSWFIDFNPVRAKIAAKQTGQDSELAAMCAISGKSEAELVQMPADDFAELKATAALFPDELVESELGEVPKGWEVSTVGEQLKTVGGATPSTKNAEFWQEGKHHWTTPKDLSNLTDKILLNTERKITDAGLRKISSGLLPKDTVLMSSRAPVGYLALSKIDVAINQGYIAILPNEKYSPEYLLQWCEANMPEIKGRATGTTFLEISKKSFREISFICADSSLINSYGQIAENLYNQIAARAAENQQLIQIRDTLLPKLLSGEIDVSTLADAESRSEGEQVA